MDLGCIYGGLMDLQYKYESFQSSLPSGIPQGWNDPPPVVASAAAPTNRLSKMRNSRPVDPSIQGSGHSYGSPYSNNSSNATQSPYASPYGQPQPQQQQPYGTPGAPQGYGQQQQQQPSAPATPYGQQQQMYTQQQQQPAGYAMAAQQGPPPPTPPQPSYPPVSPPATPGGWPAADPRSTPVPLPPQQQQQLPTTPHLGAANVPHMQYAQQQQQFAHQQVPSQLPQQSVDPSQTSQPPHPSSLPPDANSQQQQQQMSSAQGTYHRAVYDAFTVNGASRHASGDQSAYQIPPAQAAWTAASAQNAPPTQQNAPFNYADQANRNQNIPETLDYQLPNTIKEDDDGFYSAANFKAPVKAAGDVSLSGPQLIPFLIKAALRLQDVKSRGAQLKLKMIFPDLMNNRMGHNFMFWLNYLVDAIDRGDYTEARSHFEKIQTAPEMNQNWSSALNFLLLELQQQEPIQRSSSATQPRHL